MNPAVGAPLNTYPNQSQSQSQGPTSGYGQGQTQSSISTSLFQPRDFPPIMNTAQPSSMPQTETYPSNPPGSRLLSPYSPYGNSPNQYNPSNNSTFMPQGPNNTLNNQNNTTGFGNAGNLGNSAGYFDDQRGGMRQPNNFNNRQLPEEYRGRSRSRSASPNSHGGANHAKSAATNYALRNRKRERQYETVKENHKDTRLGPVKLLRIPETNTYLIEKEVNEPSSLALGKHAHKVETMIRNPSMHVVPTTDFETTDVKQFCGQFHRLNYVMINPEIDLAIQKEQNRFYNVQFTSEELTHLLYGGVQGLQHLKSLGYFHGNLKPENIMVTKTGYAVFDDPCDPKYGVTAETRHSKDLYLSPQAYKATFSKPNQGYDRYKDDVFALGLIILEVGTQNSVREIYDPKSPTLDSYKLEDRLEEFKHTYSSNVLLISAVAKMLEIDERERPNIEDINSRLPPIHTVQQFFEQNPESKRPPNFIARPSEEPGNELFKMGEGDLSVDTTESKDPVPGHFQQLPPKNFIQTTPNIQRDAQTKDTIKKYMNKSPMRLNEQPDKLSVLTKKNELKNSPSLDPRATEAHFMVDLFKNSLVEFLNTI